MVSMASPSRTTTTPCAACKFLRRKCQPECVFAPYFPPDQPQKFVQVHRVFGASNVTKLLNEVHPCHREDAVNSLAYEADMRLRDPVYGCVGVISLLHHQLRQLHLDLALARSQLSKYQQHGFVDGVSLPINNGAAAGTMGFEQLDYFFPSHHQQAMMMMRSNYDDVTDNLVAKLGANGGARDDAPGCAATLRAPSVASLVPLGGQFLRSSTAAADERPVIAPL